MAYHAGVKTDSILACSLILLKSLADAMSLSIPSLHTNCHTKKDNQTTIRIEKGCGVYYTERGHQLNMTGIRTALFSTHTNCKRHAL